MLSFNKKRIALSASIIVVLLLTITGCNWNALDNNEGTVSVTVPYLSPALQGPFNKSQGRSAATSRAFVVASKVELTLRDGSDTIIAEQTINPDMFQPFEAVPESSFSASPGIGYTIEAKIYNSSVSETVPVTTGVSAPFDVVAGNTTSVTVTCIPCNPINLVEDTASDEVELSLSTYDITTGIGEWREEAWFSFSPTTVQTTLKVLPAQPGNVGQYFMVFDSEGNHIVDISGMLFLMYGYPLDTIQLTIPTVPGETYYIGALNIQWMDNGELLLPGGPFQLIQYPAVEAYILNPVDISIDVSGNNVGDEIYSSFTIKANTGFDGALYEIYYSEPVGDINFSLVDPTAPEYDPFVDKVHRLDGTVTDAEVTVYLIITIPADEGGDFQELMPIVVCDGMWMYPGQSVELTLTY